MSESFVTGVGAMKMKMNRWAFGVLAIGIVGGIAVVGCDDKKQKQAAPPAATAEALPANLVVAAPAPARAKDVVAARNASDGDEVIVRGRVGGSEKPFTEGRAVFQLVDLALATCDKTGPMHNCKTPWDYCCDDKSD